MESTYLGLENYRVKCKRPYFNEIFLGRKYFEIREHDRDYKAGDTMEPVETWDDGDRPTGRVISGTINYVLTDFEDLLPGWCAFDFRYIWCSYHGCNVAGLP